MNQIVNAVVAACENVMTSSTASNNTAGPPLIPALSIVGLAVPVAVAFPPLPALPSFVQVDTGLPLLTASVAALNQINGDNTAGVHAELDRRNGNPRAFPRAGMAYSVQRMTLPDVSVISLPRIG